MELKLQQINNTMIVKITGELDHHYTAKIRQVIDTKIHELHIKNMIFDMSSIVFMDSSGIGVILGRYKIVHEFGGIIYLTGINQKIDRIISMSGLLNIVKIVKRNQDALDEINNSCSGNAQEIMHEIYI